MNFPPLLFSSIHLYNLYNPCASIPSMLRLQVEH